MLNHGGRLLAASEKYGRPPSEWLDLSTGINPLGWSVPPLPSLCWQRLPEENDGLETAAISYYGCNALLPVPGSQAAIQTLPRLFPSTTVICVSPIYAEHPHAWENSGHRIKHVNSIPRGEELDASIGGVVICNPNNPTGNVCLRNNILDLADQLKSRAGWLVVDEAFADPLHENSVTDVAGSLEAPNLIVLRSIGKFFGLAGVRVGFVIAAPHILTKLREAIGPWAIAGPSREVAKLALSDKAWHSKTKAQLVESGKRLGNLIATLGVVKATPLFSTVTTNRASALLTSFAERGILIRHYDPLPILRFGLPANELEWQRLASAVQEMC